MYTRCVAYEGVVTSYGAKADYDRISYCLLVSKLTSLPLNPDIARIETDFGCKNRGTLGCPPNERYKIHKSR